MYHNLCNQAPLNVSHLATKLMLMVSLLGPVVGVLGSHSPGLTLFIGADCLPALEPSERWGVLVLYFLFLSGTTPPLLSNSSLSHSFLVMTQAGTVPWWTNLHLHWPKLW